MVELRSLSQNPAPLVLANADADKDEIQFADAIAGKTLVLTQGALRIEADLLIDGPPSGFTIDGDGKSGVLSIYKVDGPDPSVTLAAMTITGGYTTGIGGGIFSQGELHLYESTVTGNHASGPAASGGGIYGDKVTLYGSTVSSNVVEGPGNYYSGGGIAAKDLTLSNSTVAGNRAGYLAAEAGQRGYGGGIVMFGDAVLSITNSTVTSNYAMFSGGGISGGNITNCLSRTVRSMPA